ncbi:MAG: 4Fe-4S dicluster domain-containing protein [Planctomycetota bacterium]|jgi:Fe-S-cluster-containing dehydrogenase component
MSSAQNDTIKMKGILTDVTKCIGCERCVEACVQVNKHGPDLPAHFKAGDGLSGSRFTSIVRTPGKTAGTMRMVRRQCMHCIEPSCQAACLVGAFKKLPGGPVVYERHKCIGCRYCMLACPFMIPRYEYDRKLPYVMKCRMNEDCRVEGGIPACTSACPTNATIFGPRDSLIKEARRRIEANPGLYIDHIYGEHEFGGTSVIYISDVPLNEALRMPTAEEFEKRAVPSLTHSSIPDLNHSWVLVTPFQFLTVMGALWGAWFFKRRSRVMHEESLKQNAADPEQQG